MGAQPEPSITEDDRIIPLVSSMIELDNTVETEFIKRLDKKDDQDDFFSVLCLEALVRQDTLKPDAIGFTWLYVQDVMQAWLSLAVRWPRNALDPLLSSVKVDMW
ncbi:hypothetical protein ACHAPA_012105 [Fusarium lateritium]